MEKAAAIDRSRKVALLLGPDPDNAGKWDAYGSGVLVWHPDSYELAVLTAVHVVLTPLVRGALGIQLPGLSLKVIRPKSIRFARRSDAALIVLERDEELEKAIPVKWRPDDGPTINNGDIIQTLGFPYERIVKVDPKKGGGHKLERSQVEIVAQNETQAGIIRCEVPDGTPLPVSLAGMSGGPAFTSGNDLCGINYSEETVHHSLGSQIIGVKLTSRRAWHDLFYPLTPPDDFPLGMWRFKQKFEGIRVGLFLNDNYQCGFTCTIFGEVFRSEASLVAKARAFGRIRSVRMTDVPHLDGKLYPISLESYFDIEHPDDPESWRDCLFSEIEKLFGEMELKIENLEELKKSPALDYGSIVRQKAYLAWEQRGRPIGSDWVDWFQAEEEIFRGFGPD